MLVAAAARLSTGTHQLVDSGLTTILINGISEFCKYEKTRQQLGIDDELKNSGSTNSDKAGEFLGRDNNNNCYLNVKDPESNNCIDQLKIHQ